MHNIAQKGFTHTVSRENKSPYKPNQVSVPLASPFTQSSTGRSV